jgi:hypothetical protein
VVVCVLLGVGVAQAAWVLEPPSRAYLPLFGLLGAMLGVGSYLEACWKSESSADTERIKLAHQECVSLISALLAGLGMVLAVFAAAGAVRFYVEPVSTVLSPFQVAWRATRGWLPLLMYFILGYILWLLRIIHRRCRLLRSQMYSPGSAY